MALRSCNNSGGTCSQTTETCVHNGNGRTSDGACTNENSGNTITQTQYKCRGQFQSTPC
jgi:hypothetical protein